MISFFSIISNDIWLSAPNIQTNSTRKFPNDSLHFQNPQHFQPKLPIKIQPHIIKPVTIQQKNHFTLWPPPKGDHNWNINHQPKRISAQAPPSPNHPIAAGVASTSRGRAMWASTTLDERAVRLRRPGRGHVQPGQPAVGGRIGGTASNQPFARSWSLPVRRLVRFRWQLIQQRPGKPPANFHMQTV